MKLSELIEKYGDCEVKEELVDMVVKPKGDWKPKIKDKYFYINARGECNFSWWGGSTVDCYRLEKRNVYRTEEEAQFSLDMYNFCKERSFEPDWGKESQCAYFLFLNKNKVYTDYLYSDRHFLPFYYPSAKAAEEIINKYSFEELAKYYGRV